MEPQNPSSEDSPEKFEIRKVPSLANAFSRDQSRFSLPVPSYMMTTSSQSPPSSQLPLPQNYSSQNSSGQTPGTSQSGAETAAAINQNQNNDQNGENTSKFTPLVPIYPHSVSPTPKSQSPPVYNPSLPAHLSHQFSQQYNQLLSRPVRQVPKSTNSNNGSSNNSSTNQSADHSPSQSSVSTIFDANTTRSQGTLDSDPNRPHDKHSTSPTLYKSILNSEHTSNEAVDSQFINSFRVKQANKRKHVHNQYSDFSQVKEHDLGRDNIDRPYKCSFANCRWAFVRESDLRRHLKSHEAPSFHCPYWRHESNCHRNGGAFSRLDVLKRHLRLIHYIQDKQQSRTQARSNPPGKDDPGWCKACQKVFSNSKSFLEHVNECSEQLGPPPDNLNSGNEYLMDPDMNLRTLSSVIEYDNNDFPNENDDPTKTSDKKFKPDTMYKLPKKGKQGRPKKNPEGNETDLTENKEENEENAQQTTGEGYELPSQIRKSRRNV